MVYNCTLEQEYLDNDYRGHYAQGEMMKKSLYHKILYDCCRLNAIKLKLDRTSTLFSVELRIVEGQVIAEHVIRVGKVIPASLVKARNYRLLIITRML